MDSVYVTSAGVSAAPEPAFQDRACLAAAWVAWGATGPSFAVLGEHETFRHSPMQKGCRNTDDAWRRSRMSAVDSQPDPRPSRPLLIAADDDPAVLAALRRLLSREPY